MLGGEVVNRFEAYTSLENIKALEEIGRTASYLYVAATEGLFYYLLFSYLVLIDKSKMDKSDRGYNFIIFIGVFLSLSILVYDISSMKRFSFIFEVLFLISVSCVNYKVSSKLFLLLVYGAIPFAILRLVLNFQFGLTVSNVEFLSPLLFIWSN